MATTGQLLLRGLDGRTSCLLFSSSIITGSAIHERIASILRLPRESLVIRTGTSFVHPHTTLCADSDGLFPSCSILLRLRGGKGGFGSLLRGAATKAGQKKTSNYDACRDMSGRRLRHVNAEKKLKEWKAQAKERELEKAANEFLKKQVKRKEDDSGCSQLIEKFREDTSKAREEVESAVARGLAEAKRFGKRKVVDDEILPASSSKRPHSWLESEIDMAEDDERCSSDDEDEEGEEGSENEDREEGSNEYVKAEGVDFTKAEERSDSEKLEEAHEHANAENVVEAEKQLEKVEEMLGEDHFNGYHNAHVDNVHVEEVIKCSVSLPNVMVMCEPEPEPELEIKSEPGSNALLSSDDNRLQRGTNSCSLAREQTQEELNVDRFNQASDLEALGLERLKCELQKRGLKCGGSLAERAGRLFLLKTVPLEKLDKKHFAKVRG